MAITIHQFAQNRPCEECFVTKMDKRFLDDLQSALLSADKLSCPYCHKKMKTLVLDFTFIGNDPGMKILKEDDPNWLPVSELRKKVHEHDSLSASTYISALIGSAPHEKHTLE